MLLTTIHQHHQARSSLKERRKKILSRGNRSATFFVRKGSQLPFKSHETNTTQIHVEKHRKNKTPCMREDRTITKGSREYVSTCAPSLVYSIALTSVCFYMLLYSLKKLSVGVFYQLISPIGLAH